MDYFLCNDLIKKLEPIFTRLSRENESFTMPQYVKSEDFLSICEILQVILYTERDAAAIRERQN